MSLTQERLTIALLVMFLLLPSFCKSQPALNDVSGVLEDGESVVLTGSLFGSGAYLPVSWDDFETGVSGDELSVPVVGPSWSFLSQAPYPSYSTLRSVSGNTSAHITWENYSISSFGWSNQGPYRSIYLSFWRYMNPANPNVLPTNMKILYIYGNDEPEFMIGAIMPTRGNWQYAVQPDPTANYSWDVSRHYTTTNNTWQRWEVFVELESSPNANDGQIIGWLDGVLTLERSGLDLSDTGGRFEDLRLGHMFQGYTGNDHCYYDDVYISESQARVELGNAPVFSECTVRTIQQPIEWSNGNIQISFRTSSFLGGEQAYLFVVDEQGVASEGLQVTLGGIVDPGPPGEPGKPVKD